MKKNNFITRVFEIIYFKVSQLKQAGKCLSSDSDIEHLNLPKTLDVLVKKFINTYSGDYINDLYED